MVRPASNGEAVPSSSIRKVGFVSHRRNRQGRLSSGGDEPSGSGETGTSAKDVEELGKRLRRARQDAGLEPEPEQEPMRLSGVGIGLRIATELVVALVVGGAIGWFLDKWLNTAPWLMIVFLFFGFAAGTLNIIRTMSLPQDEQK